MSLSEMDVRNGKLFPALCSVGLVQLDWITYVVLKPWVSNHTMRFSVIITFGVRTSDGLKWKCGDIGDLKIHLPHICRV